MAYLSMARKRGFERSATASTEASTFSMASSLATPRTPSHDDDHICWQLPENAPAEENGPLLLSSVISLGDEMPSWLHPPTTKTHSTNEAKAGFAPSGQTATSAPTPPIHNRTRNYNVNYFNNSSNDAAPFRRSLSVDDTVEQEPLSPVIDESARWAAMRRSASADCQLQTPGSKPRGFLQQGLSTLLNRPSSPRKLSKSSPKGPHKSAVIIFDWDDTLLPTSYIKFEVLPTPHTSLHQLPLPRKSPHYQKFFVHALVVEETLRAASKVGQVAIVTSATRCWVKNSAERYLPGLDFEALLRDLDVKVYPADRQSPLAQAIAKSGKDPSKVAKKVAMAECLDRAYDDHGPELVWNVLSVGDSVVERDALKECLGNKEAICKTIKLRENLPVEELTKDLQSLIPNLGPLAGHQESFDRTMSNLNLAKTGSRILGL